MSSKRYWSKMNHAEARNAIELMSDAEAGRWLRGWLSGAFGEESTDGTPMEWRMGFSAGKDSLRDAEEFSKKQAERVSARYAKATTVDPVEEKLPEDTGDTTEFQRIPLGLPITEQTNKQTNNNTLAKIEAIYQAYPKHVAKDAALRAIAKAVRAVGADELMEAVCAYSKAVDGSDKNLLPHPATWFNGGCWKDDRSTWKPRLPWGAQAQRQESKPLNFNPGDLDGIDMEDVAKL